MIISGFERLTLLNYPGHVACIIFTGGCDLNCSYCQNSMFIDDSYGEIIKEYEVLEYLKKRKNVLDGIVISGGEPTVQRGLAEFARKVKELGYKVKLDTNGHSPKVIEKLLDENLVDYVAMDIKNDFKDYKKVIGKCNFNIDNILKSIELLKSSNIEFEFRTTVIKGYHTVNSIKRICQFLGNNVNYYLQNFENSDNVKDKSLSSFSDEELADMYKKLKKDFPNLKIRGLKEKLYKEEELNYV